MAEQERLGARALIDHVADPDSYVSWDSPPDHTGFDDDYRAALAKAAERAGTDESVITGRVTIQGHPVGMIVGEFGFLGGSIGRETARRIVAAVERATTERLPLIAATSSGGTRMQEGTPAFVRMVDISRAVVAHKAAGLPYLVYLRHPTTGGVFASWGSLGHMSVAEPGALIGFLGPVVYEALHGTPFPDGVQVAENLVESGIVDAVVPTADLATVAARALTLLSPSDARTPEAPAPCDLTAAADRAAWESIELTRRDDRPGVRELLRHASDDVIPLNGTGSGESDDALFLALTSLHGTRCVLVGQDRRTQHADKLLGPAALRSARRGFRIAEELRLPLVTVIDTPGADLSAAAEEGALAGEIAKCLAELSALSVPSVSVLLGEGTGGGALALLPAGRQVAAEHAWLSPLPPEGASVIMHRTVDRAGEMAARQGVRSVDLLDAGVVDSLVAEPMPAHEDPVGFARAVAAEVVRQLHAQA